MAQRHIVSLVACAVAACSSPVVTPDAGDVGCSTRTDVDVYAAGLERTSSNGSWKVKLVAAEPAPPARGSNQWTIRVSSSTGGSPEGPKVSATMPEHGHNAPLTPVVSFEAGSGNYEVRNLELFMPGVWVVTVSPSADAGVGDGTAFKFCIDG